MKASREGISLAEFKYACVGYSVYFNGKDASVDRQQEQSELPICVGLEVIISVFYFIFFLLFIIWGSVVLHTS